jgi:hypothetical protein
MKKAISFDLETLGTRATSVILALGAVVFDETQLYEKVHIKFSIQDQLNWGRTIDGATLLFWFEQSPEARLAATQAPAPFIKALEQFGGFVQAQAKNVELWANGQDFDLGMLGHAYDLVGRQRPWQYNAGRDMRTLIALTGGKKPNVAREDGELHNALGDAVFQARIIQTLIKEIK